MTRYDYTLTFDPGGPNEADISDFVEVLDWTEIGSGSVTSMKVRLNAIRGKFIKLGSDRIKEFDRFRLDVTSGGITFSRVYETQTLIPIENTSEGNVLEVECLGLEYHLQKIHFARQFYFEQPFDVLIEIINQYETSRASLQPEVEDFDTSVGNELPEYIADNFEFNIAETFCYDGLKELVDRLGNATVNAGGGNFWELFFIKGSTDDKIKIRTPISGTPDSGVILTDFSLANEDPTEGGIDNITGTIVGAWGADDLGSQPPEFAEFSGLLEAFEFFPRFVTPSVEYPEGSYVELDDVKYRQGSFPFDQSITTTAIPPASPWVVIEAFDYLQDQTIYPISGSVQYSPWTKNNFEFWKNSAGNPEGAGPDFLFPAFFDSNLVIFDEDRFQTWVDVRRTSPGAIPSEWLMSGVNPYRTLRVLVDGVGSGDFTGEDNNIMEYTLDGKGGLEWVRKYTPEDDWAVAVFEESKVYEFIAGTWTDISAVAQANHCWHIPSGISNEPGDWQGTFDDATQTTRFSDNSAVEAQYDWTALVGILGADTPNFYKVGAWIGLRFPIPRNSFNGESIASEFGNAGGFATIPPFEPATIDSRNMGLSHRGKTGFNNLDAEEYGPMSSVNFELRMGFFFKDGVLGLIPQGNFKMRCTIYDSFDNSMSQDFVIPFNNIWAQISLPLQTFQVYRARTPLRFLDIVQASIVNDLDVRQRFQWRNVTAIAIQWQESYDEQGRYAPNLGRANEDSFFSGGGRTIITIDAVHFGKPLFTTTSALNGEIATGRVLEPDFLQLPYVSNMQQLRQAALSQLEIEQFPHKMYEIRTDGALDIDFGENFILKKSKLVFDLPIPSDEIPLVAKKIRYKISKPRNSPGTFERFLTGIKRFT